MKSRVTQHGAVALALAAGALGLIGSAQVRADIPLTAFTPGDLVVMRGGDSNFSNTTGTGDANGEVNAYLDEYTTSGSYVGTLSVGSGLTLPGFKADSHEGELNLSVDGHFLTFGGYTNAAGAAPRLTDGTQTESIGIVGNSASSLNTSTLINPADGTGQFIRSVATVDGTSLYVAGKNPNSGLKLVTGIGPGRTVSTLQGTTDWRALEIYNSTLYGGTGSSSVGTHGAYQIGATATLPATSADATNNLLTNYAGGQSGSNLALVNTQTSDAGAMSQNGFNTLYTIGDQVEGSIVKYYFDGTMWQHADFEVAFASPNLDDPTGIVAYPDATNPAWIDLFVSGQEGIYSYIDKSGDPLAALSANQFTLLAGAPTDGAFYGLALAPSAVVPEPTSLGLLAVGAVAMMRRRRQA